MKEGFGTGQQKWSMGLYEVNFDGAIDKEVNMGGSRFGHQEFRTYGGAHSVRVPGITDPSAIEALEFAEKWAFKDIIVEIGSNQH